MKKIIFSLFAVMTALCMTSCLNGYSEYKYSSNMNFEFQGLDDKEVFGDTTFYFKHEVTFDLTFKRNTDKDTTMFYSGFALAFKKDSIYVEGDPLPDPFVVFDCDTTIKSNHFLVYRQNDDPAKNMDKPIVFNGTKYGTCTMSHVFVANTHLSVVRAQAENGFDKADHAEAIFTGYLNGTETASVKAPLFEYGVPIRRWKKIDLSKLGQIDAIGVKISSSKEGIVEEFAMDSMVAEILVRY